MKFLLVAIAFLIAFTATGQKALHIYGGKEHDVYLGCLTCDNYDRNSIWNEYSTYGSKYNAKSIWNKYGSYGSDYSDTSPFNAYASNPPVIVDKDGGFYGYFTVNEYKQKRADFKLVQIIYKNFNAIRDNLTSWYEKIFK